MIRRQTVLNVALGVGAIVLSFGIARNLQLVRAQSHIVDGVSVVLQEVLTYPDGTKKLSGNYHYATNTDGSWTFVPGVTPENVEDPVRIVQLSSGEQGYVSDNHRQRYIKKGNGSYGTFRLPSAKCVAPAGKESPAGEEWVSGYRTEKIVMGSLTSWYALDYSCGLVKSHADWSDGGKTDQYLLLLSPGAPDQKLFAVPADYADVPMKTFTH